MVSGSDSRSEPSQLSDRDLVESVLRDLSEAADKWEALVTQAETVTYSVDLGDVRAVANSDGRLLELTLHPGVMTGYAHGELADRVNLAITALRDASGVFAWGVNVDTDNDRPTLARVYRKPAGHLSGQLESSGQTASLLVDLKAHPPPKVAVGTESRGAKSNRLSAAADRHCDNAPTSGRSDAHWLGL